MVSLQSSSAAAALLPEATANKRPPWLSLVGSVVASSTGGTSTAATTSKKRKRDGGGRDDDRGEVVDGIELNFDAAPLPPEWQRCLDIKSGQIHYYNTRTQKRTWKDPRGEPDYRAAPSAANDEDEDDEANRAPPGLDLELNLTFEPRRPLAHEKKKPKQAPAPAANKAADDRRRQPAKEAEDSSSNSMSSSREMVAGVCVRCHMLVMMCRASPACPNCKFLHPPTTRAAPPPPSEPEPEPPAALKLGLQLLCCRD